MIENKLITRLKKELLDSAVSLAESPAEDFAKYMKRVGRHHGLQEALDIIHELLNDDSDPT